MENVPAPLEQYVQVKADKISFRHVSTKQLERFRRTVFIVASAMFAWMWLFLGFWALRGYFHFNEFVLFRSFFASATLFAAMGVTQVLYTKRLAAEAAWQALEQATEFPTYQAVASTEADQIKVKLMETHYDHYKVLNRSYLKPDSIEVPDKTQSFAAGDTAGAMEAIAELKAEAEELNEISERRRQAAVEAREQIQLLNGTSATTSSNTLPALPSA